MYNGIPHLLFPVVTDLRKSTAALQWAVAEMTERYRKFAECGVRDLTGYNKSVEKYFSSDESPPKLPGIVIVIDDFSDLMIADNRSTEESICRLAQMGRVAGIHLVISTQRPLKEQKIYCLMVTCCFSHKVQERLCVFREHMFLIKK